MKVSRRKIMAGAVKLALNGQLAMIEAPLED